MQAGAEARRETYAAFHSHENPVRLQEDVNRAWKGLGPGPEAWLVGRQTRQVRAAGAAFTGRVLPGGLSAKQSQRTSSWEAEQKPLPVGRARPVATLCSRGHPAGPQSFRLLNRLR